MEKKNNIIKIAVTGPESSGKSYLCRFLANKFNGSIVEEFARTYLSTIQRPYTYNDLLYIAEQQMILEQRAIDSGTQIILMDTELINMKIWSVYRFGKYPEQWEEQIKNSGYDLYLLLAPDIPWEEDPLRENPHDRWELFSSFENELKGYQKNYAVIRGEFEEREKLAISILKKKLINNELRLI